LYHKLTHNRAYQNIHATPLRPQRLFLGVVSVAALPEIVFGGRFEEPTYDTASFNIVMLAAIIEDF